MSSYAAPISEKYVHTLMPTSGFTAEYVDYGMFCTDAYAPFHVLGALSQLSAVCNPYLEFPGPDGGISASFWGMIIGPSGDHKSTSVKMSKRLVKKVDPTRVARADMGSTEAFTQYVVDNQRVFLAYTEWAAMLDAMEKSFLADFKSRLMQAWDGDDFGRLLIRNRADKNGNGKKNGAGPKDMQHTTSSPRVTILGCIVPELLLEKTKQSDWLNGFYPRWCIVSGKSERAYPQPRVDNRRFEDLCALLDERKVRSSVPPKGFTAEAAAYYEGWCSAIRADAGSNPVKLAISARAPTIALKAALLYSEDLKLASAAAWELGLDVVKPAVALATLHIQSCQALTRNVWETREEQDRLKVLITIPEAGGIHLGEILNQTKMMKKKVLSWLETLQASGQVQATSGPDGTYYSRLAVQPFRTHATAAELQTTLPAPINGDSSAYSTLYSEEADYPPGQVQ